MSALYGDATQGLLSIFTLPDKKAGFFPVAQLGLAAAYAQDARDRQDVHFGLGLQGQVPKKGRGTAEEVIGIPGMWADVDFLGPAHKSNRLPPTLQAAEFLILHSPCSRRS